MSIDVRRIAVQVAHRTLQIEGTNQTDLETAYSLVLDTLDGADVPLSALKDAVLAVEAELTEIIANDRNHPYRALFYGRSDDLVSGERIPSESDELIRFVGIMGGVKDADDHQPLTETTIQEIRRFLRGEYQTEIYKYALAGERLYHTRTNAYMEGCVFSGTVARTRFSSPYRLSPIPESLESTWVARTIQYLVTEGWLQAAGSYYGEFAQSGIARLRDRNMSLPQLPAIESTPNPITN